MTLLDASGLPISSSVKSEKREHAGALTQREGANNSAPSLNRSFVEDLKHYSKKMSRRYEARWNPRYQIYVIWAEDPSSGQMFPIRACYNEAYMVEKYLETGGEYHLLFRQPNHEDIERIYSSDLFVKWKTNNPDAAAEKESRALDEAERLAKERIYEGMSADAEAIEKDAWNDFARIKHAADYGHISGYKPLHQVHLNTPTSR